LVREEVIGDARMICGDCREVLPGLTGVTAVVTDPPYGISMAHREGSKKHGWTAYTDSDWDKEPPPDDLMRAILAIGDYHIVWGGNYFLPVLKRSTKWLIWDKGQTDFSLADAELAYCSWPGAIRRMTYSRGAALQDGKEHPTQKAAVMVWCINQIPEDGGKVILDPFMGSGTTGVACARLKRKFIGVELSEKYFDIACRRIETAQRQHGEFARETAATQTGLLW
jgi:DNA modification methylase